MAEKSRELSYLLEPSHNAHFHALMDRYFPPLERGAERDTSHLPDGG